MKIIIIARFKIQFYSVTIGPRSSADPQGDNIERIEVNFQLEITEELRKLVCEAIARALSWK